jgi:hypothetical protein
MRWLMCHGYIQRTYARDRAIYVIHPQKRGHTLVKWYVRGLVRLGLEPRRDR